MSVIPPPARPPSAARLGPRARPSRALSRPAPAHPPTRRRQPAGGPPRRRAAPWARAPPGAASRRRRLTRRARSRVRLLRGDPSLGSPLEVAEHVAQVVEHQRRQREAAGHDADRPVHVTHGVYPAVAGRDLNLRDPLGVDGVGALEQLLSQLAQTIAGLAGAAYGGRPAVG